MRRRNKRPSVRDLAIATLVVAESIPKSVVEGHDHQWWKNIYPREIEEVLLRHLNLVEASVVGQPHPDWGEEVVTFPVRRPRATVGASELDSLCREHIARFKRQCELIVGDCSGMVFWSFCCLCESSLRVQRLPPQVGES